MSGATTRLFQRSKLITMTFTSLSADTLLTTSDLLAYQDISNVDWERIIFEANVTTLTGTQVIFKGLTTNDPTNAGATTDAAATQGDGTTAVVSATITAVGRYVKGISRRASDGSACSNVGKYLGFWADVTSVTVLTGTLNIFVLGS